MLGLRLLSAGTGVLSAAAIRGHHAAFRAVIALHGRQQGGEIDSELGRIERRGTLSFKNERFWCPSIFGSGISVL
jgi:hypothetical protein